MIGVIGTKYLPKMQDPCYVTVVLRFKANMAAVVGPQMKVLGWDVKRRPSVHRPDVFEILNWGSTPDGTIAVRYTSL
jgi:hypothetical protein